MDSTQAERDSLYAQLASYGRNWTELHYCINDFCEMLAIPYGMTRGWEQHQAINEAVLDVFVTEAKKRGWAQ